MPKTPTDKFLRAIRKYATEQKNAMISEVNQLKTERLKEAEERAERDSEELILQKLEESRNRRTVILAAKTKEGQKKLFVERSAMVEDVFKKAADKLIAYTATDAYAEKLPDSVKAICDVFDGRDCVLYVSERDLTMAEKLKAAYGGNAAVESDPAIRIGGVRGECSSLRLIADETLDSKLESQRGWFVENAALSVL